MPAAVKLKRSESMLREPEHMPGITVVTAKHFADERGFLLQ